VNQQRRNFVIGLGAGASSLLVNKAAFAQASAVRVLVGFPPGGAIDLTARVLAEHLQSGLGGPVVVDNRPGAAGNIAAIALKQAKADGMTLMLAPVNVYCISPVLYKNLQFDPVKDFAPAGTMASFPWGLAVSSGVPANSVPELVAWLKANPQSANCGMAAPGSEGHLLAFAFSRATGVKLNFIGYKGGAPMTQDLIGGQIPMVFDSIVNQIAPHNGGRIRVLAVSGSARCEALPRIPTMAELGYKEVTGETWIGMAVPRGTPDARIAELNAAFAGVARDPAVKARLAQIGLTAQPGTPDGMAKLITSDAERWGALVKQLGLQLD
jgi:tripartite-type tricarboxylate transporter receptor subunit TctC